MSLEDFNSSERKFEIKNFVEDTTNFKIAKENTDIEYLNAIFGIIPAMSVVGGYLIGSEIVDKLKKSTHIFTTEEIKRLKHIKATRRSSSRNIQEN